MRPIITLADGIEVLETTGDLDAFQFGGGVVYRTPEKDIYWQFWEPRETGRKNFYVFTAPVPEQVLKFYDFVDIKILCTVGATDKREVQRLSRSRDPKERAYLVGIIKDAYGPSGVDPDETAEVLTPWDLSARWGDVYGTTINEVPQADLDDYIVREQKIGNGYECGRVTGDYIGKFDSYDKCLAAVAQYMSRNDGFSPNLFHEHEVGKLELVDWDPKEYLNMKLSSRKRVVATAPWKNSMKKYINDDKIKARIKSRHKSQKSVIKARQKSQARLNREKRIERARNFRRSMEELY